MNFECDLCEDDMWICEQHQNKPWPHDDCPGPGEPCCCNPDAELPKGFEIICEVE